MMKKINNWWNKPWTNGTYVKFCLGGAIGSLLYLAVWWLAMTGKFTDIKDKAEDLLNHR